MKIDIKDIIINKRDVFGLNKNLTHSDLLGLIPTRMTDPYSERDDDWKSTQDVNRNGILDVSLFKNIVSTIRIHNPVAGYAISHPKKRIRKKDSPLQWKKVEAMFDNAGIYLTPMEHLFDAACFTDAEITGYVFDYNLDIKRFWLNSEISVFYIDGIKYFQSVYISNPNIWKKDHFLDPLI